MEAGYYYSWVPWTTVLQELLGTDVFSHRFSPENGSQTYIFFQKKILLYPKYALTRREQAYTVLYTPYFVYDTLLLFAGGEQRNVALNFFLWGASSTFLCACKQFKNSTERSGTGPKKPRNSSYYCCI